MIHIEELEIELIKTGSLIHDVTFEVRTRGRHEKTQRDVNKMYLRPVQLLIFEMIEHTYRNVSCRVGRRIAVK